VAIATFALTIFAAARLAGQYAGVSANLLYQSAQSFEREVIEISQRHPTLYWDAAHGVRFRRSHFYFEINFKEISQS
jgi:hypothetical protein